MFFYQNRPTKHFQMLPLTKCNMSHAGAVVIPSLSRKETVSVICYHKNHTDTIKLQLNDQVTLSSPEFDTDIYLAYTSLILSSVYLCKK